MNPNGSVELLCQAALNSLKSYGRKEFTKRFLKKQGLPIDQDLKDMWISIERWLENDASKCRDLWEYVDDIRLWGRQRIFLYEVDGSYAAELLDPQFVKGLVGGVYEQPLFKWEAEEPFLSLVKHTNAANTESQLLIFKLIENRKYIQVIDGKNETFEINTLNCAFKSYRPAP